MIEVDGVRNEFGSAPAFATQVDEAQFQRYLRTIEGQFCRILAAVGKTRGTISVIV